MHDICDLYHKAALSLLHKRMSAYKSHESFSQNSSASDIKSPLIECINHVVVDEKTDRIKTRSYDVGSPVLGSATNHVSTEGLYSTEQFGSNENHMVFPVSSDNNECEPNPFVIDKERVSELSRYFKEKQKGLSADPGIKEKLKHSVWDHINASISSARKGNKRNAEMHADIANTAFNEVAHYMSEEQYSKLTSKVNDRLTVLKSCR